MKLYVKLILIGAFALPSVMMAEEKMCTMIYDPVCGVDGKTYGNSCTADNSGVKIDYKGECKNPAPTTGSNEPMACTEIYKPVCGKVNVQCIKAPCNPVYETFSNKCTLEQNKLAEFAYEGECKADNQPSTQTGDKQPDALDNYFLKKKMITDLRKIQVLTRLEDMILDLRMSAMMTPSQSERINDVLEMISDKKVSIQEKYIRSSIGSLSIIKPSLGGKWYVSDINWSGYTAIVDYEDGHTSEKLNVLFTDNLYPTILIPAFIQSISGNKISIDPIEWYTGEEANEEAIKDKVDEDGYAPNSYHIRNLDKNIYTISMNNPTVIMQTYSMSGNKLNLNQEIALKDFIKYFKGLSNTYSKVPFHISIQNGKVINILEQFIP